VEAEIRGGERHAFRLELPAGTFATGRVEQRGVDLVVEVLGSQRDEAHREARTVDDFFDTAGPIDFSVLVAPDRCADLVVTPRLASAAAGSYTIAISTSRLAEPGDALRVRSEALFSEAVALRREGKADSLRAAIERLLEAARLSGEAGDLIGKASALGSASVIHYLLSEHRRAAELSETALSLHEAAGNREGISSSHLNLSALYSQLGDVELAQKHHLQAIALKREIGDPRGEATALNNFGVYLGETGDKQQALVVLEQALALRREARDRVGEGATLANLGALYNMLGESETAKEYLEQSLPLTRDAQGGRELTTSLNLLGRVRLDLGDTTGAEQAQTEALEIQRPTGDRRGEATSIYNLGEIPALRGDHARAIELFEQALSLQRALGNKRGEARALTALGSSYAARGEAAEAKAAFEAALPLRVSTADRGGEIVTRLGLGRLLLSSGDVAGARREATAAVDLVEAMRAKVTAQELRAGYLASFRSVYDLLVDVLMSLDETEPGKGHAAEALSVHERGRARALLEELRESQVELRGVQEVREGSAGEELLDRERILRRTLASKAEVQMRLLSRKEPDASAAAEVGREIDAIRLELDRVEAKIRAESPRYSALDPAAPLSLAEIQAEVLDGDSVLLEYALSSDQGYLWVVSREGMKARRIADPAKVEEKARRAYELLAAPPTPTRVAGDELATLLRGLSETLIQPAALEIAGKRIVVVPDGALQFLPLGVLPDPGHPGSPLLSHHEVVLLPSAAVGAFLRRTGSTSRFLSKGSPAGTLAVFADPVFSADDERVAKSSRPPGAGASAAAATAPVGASATRAPLARALREAGLEGLPRLPFTRREAETILALVPAGQRLAALDFEASLDAVRSPRLADFRILHFATHGFLAGSHPQYSGIVLSLVDEQGVERRGFLSTADVFNLRLSPDLVVLSGCRTGLGKVVAGEGVVGLTRSFLHAGARRVVASLWPVDDAATAELMRRFYEGMLGERRLSPVAALREAQLALSSKRRWQAPFYWAGFQVQGEWR
jgi:CHAT domain-containing protein/tetratricopeptide (TPR) repeat protein